MALWKRCCWGIVGLSLVASAGTGQIGAADVVSPLSPDESVRRLEIPAGLKVEIVAAEPDVSAPVAIAFDERGRMWVVEMSDYPNGPAKGEAGKSRIRVLTDEDHDGRYDHPVVFAENLLFANGILPWQDGVIVTMDGTISFLRDTNGDGRADEITPWFTGFARENPQLRCNHPTLGWDGWIYVANGLRGGVV